MNDKVLCAIDSICEQIKPGKKMLQKLLYLMERKGLQLDLDYSIHYYGPYSSELDQKLRVYEAFNLIAIKPSSMTHTISIASEVIRDVTPEENDIIADVIGKYAHNTPLELELLTTADYVANTILVCKNASREDIIKEVLRIKGSKFSIEKINASITRLETDSFLSLAG